MPTARQLQPGVALRALLGHQGGHVIVEPLHAQGICPVLCRLGHIA